MSSSFDPFGGPGSVPQNRGNSTSTQYVMAQPGQEIRIVVPDDSGYVAAYGDSSPSPAGSGDSSPSPEGSGDSSPSPAGSGDSSPSPEGSGDSSPSPEGSGDSSPSPAGSGDAFDPFASGVRRPIYGGSVLTIVAQRGQNVVVQVPGYDGRVMAIGDSSPSPEGSGDSSPSPEGSGDSRW